MLIVLLLTSCARVLPPEGGLKDEIPPILERSLSTPDRQTNFRPVQVDLVFDEWIQLKDAIKHIVISPPTSTPPRVLAKGKRVEVQFDKNEPWKDSTTYTLFFGQAISDRSEGNVIPDMKFVFSTGPVLDSLGAAGIIIDAKTRQPIPDILLILHRSSLDSAIAKELPNYFTRSNKEGRYQFTNLREGNYRLFGLDDRNNNYRFDQPNERLAWLNEPIIITANQRDLPRLELPPASKKLRIISIDSIRQPGSVIYAFNRPPVQWINPLSNDSFPIFQWTADTLLTVWQQKDSDGGWFIADGDTIYFPAFKDSLRSINHLPRLVRQGKQPAELPLQLVFAPPIFLPDSSLIEVWNDSTSIPIRSLSINTIGDTLSILGVTPSESSLVLRFLPGSIQTRTGVTNVDSMAMGYQTSGAGDWAMLELTIDSIQTSNPILLEITDSSGKPVLGIIRSEAVSTWIVPLPPLMPGSYLLFLSADLNGNGQWDAADYFNKTPAEPRSVHVLPTLRANWELELKIVPTW